MLLYNMVGSHEQSQSLASEVMIIGIISVCRAMGHKNSLSIVSGVFE